MKTHRATTADAEEPSMPHHHHSFGSYKHSLAPLHTSSTIALPGSKFCITQTRRQLPSSPQIKSTLFPNKLPHSIVKHPPTHRKHNHNLPFPFDHHREVIPHLEPSEGLVDEDVADLGRGYEARGAGEEVGGGEGGGLDAEGAEG